MITRRASVRLLRTSPAVWVVVLGSLPWLLSMACMRYEPVVVRPATLGEELLSIEDARKQGLVTQQECDAMRAQLIERWKAIAEAPIQEFAPEGTIPRIVSPAPANAPAPAPSKASPQ